MLARPAVRVGSCGKLPAAGTAPPKPFYCRVQSIAEVLRATGRRAPPGSTRRRWATPWAAGDDRIADRAEERAIRSGSTVRPRQCSVHAAFAGRSNRLGGVAEDDAREYGLRLERAKAQYGAGQYAKARDTLRKVIALGERVWGPDSLRLVDALDWLAMALDRKRHEPATPEELALHKRVLRIVERACGPEHISTAGALQRLALDHWGLRRMKAARALYERALRIAEGAVSADDWRIREIRGSLGSLLVEMRCAKDAVPHLQQDAVIVDAQNHALTRLITHRMLGRALLDSGRAREALVSLQTALDLATSGGPAHLVPELRRWLDEAQRATKPRGPRRTKA